MPERIFSYTAFPIRSKTFPGGIVRQRPMVKVVLEHGDLALSARALLDTGADCCSFPLEMGKQLGLISENDADFDDSMISHEGSPPSCYRKVILHIEDFDPYEILANFSPSLDRAKYLLLGNDGFFDHFDVRFDLPNWKFSIEPMYESFLPSVSLTE